ncbi:hypothetical protein DPMN_147352 [Dreissena polymorpha]|uniref:Uncharacterized protein n=1 Tax=Dreissena polymorpha TaxID=45954 RepID=A0A9D4FC22_DREPO|nr:hypothetical protein DPMN_147352 [Dreissena polymorpha]
MPMLDLYGSHVGTYIGPMWAANMGPRWVVQPGSIWVPSGLPHILSWGSPDGTHVEPGCTSHLGPMLAAHMGPILVPTWDPYGSHIDCLLGKRCNAKRWNNLKSSVVVVVLCETSRIAYIKNKIHLTLYKEGCSSGLRRRLFTPGLKG